MAKNVKSYTDYGVSISKPSINVGDKVTISYDGLLAKSGADTIYTHIGYGDTWEKKDFIRMDNEEGIFKAAIEVANAGSLNISFKDSADNWDNNSAENYSFKVAKKEKENATTKEPAKVKNGAEKAATGAKAAAKEPAPKKIVTKAKPAKEKKKA